MGRIIPWDEFPSLLKDFLKGTLALVPLGQEEILELTIESMSLDEDKGIINVNCNSSSLGLEFTVGREAYLFNGEAAMAVWTAENTVFILTKERYLFIRNNEFARPVEYQKIT
ncbi:MAG: hypothetical protein NVSMB66_3270 [Candidatus Doudnabacteria bacterium]